MKKLINLTLEDVVKLKAGDKVIFYSVGENSLADYFKKEGLKSSKEYIIKEISFEPTIQNPTYAFMHLENVRIKVPYKYFGRIISAKTKSKK